MKLSAPIRPECRPTCAGLRARSATALLALFALFAPLGSAQQRAHGKLFVRIDTGVARAAVQIAIEPGFHIYHGPDKADLGAGDVVQGAVLVTAALYVLVALMADLVVAWTDPRVRESL